MFSKLMDLLSEEALASGRGFQMFEDLSIALLLWMDNVVSFADGTKEQWSVLGRLDQFAKDHKLKWGQEKCQVMKVGKHDKNGNNEWKIGEMPISETKSYKYLGDIITNDGKNTKNLENRRNRTISTTISIKTIATNDVFRDIGTAVLMQLHDTNTLSALLTNCESWTLLKKENEQLQQIEIQSIKLLFDLPSHTPTPAPTPALIYTLGLLYTSLRVEKRKFLYLWKVINRYPSHWTYKALTHILTKKIGWGKSCDEFLTKHDLPSNLQVIKNLTRNEWTKKVNKAVEKNNKDQLLDDLHKTELGIIIRKTKTASIVDLIEKPDYQRKPLPEIMKCSKVESKAIIMGRFGMLECGKNYKGTKSETSNDCNELDDENHRLNYCSKYRDINFFNHTLKIDFRDIYSNDELVLRKIVDGIKKVWNVHNANGTLPAD